MAIRYILGIRFVHSARLTIDSTADNAIIISRPTLAFPQQSNRIVKLD
jgi:hypothetical protein